VGRIPTPPPPSRHPITTSNHSAKAQNSHHQHMHYNHQHMHNNHNSTSVTSHLTSVALFGFRDTTARTFPWLRLDFNILGFF
jgi:hypothetical protein